MARGENPCPGTAAATDWVTRGCLNLPPFGMYGERAWRLSVQSGQREPLARSDHISWSHRQGERCHWTFGPCGVLGGAVRQTLRRLPEPMLRWRRDGEASSSSSLLGSKFSNSSGPLPGSSLSSSGGDASLAAPVAIARRFSMHSRALCSTAAGKLNGHDVMTARTAATRVSLLSHVHSPN
jgi:hypothetical protein